MNKPARVAGILRRAKTGRRVFEDMAFAMECVNTGDSAAAEAISVNCCSAMRITSRHI